MQTKNPLLDDMARLFSGALGIAGGMRQEAEAQLRSQLERVLSRMDLVSREDFEVVREMAQKARAEQETLSERVAMLEAELASLRKKPAGRERKKSSTENTVSND